MMLLDNFYDIDKQFYYGIYTYDIIQPLQMILSEICKKESDEIFYNNVIINVENHSKFDEISLFAEVSLQKSIIMPFNLNYMEIVKALKINISIKSILYYKMEANNFEFTHFNSKK